MNSAEGTAPAIKRGDDFERRLDLLDEACRVATRRARLQHPYGTDDELKARAWEILTGRTSFPATP